MRARISRRQHSGTRLCHGSDLTDAECPVIAPLQAVLEKAGAVGCHKTAALAAYTFLSIDWVGVESREAASTLRRNLAADPLQEQR
jgi:hypothetical protein